MKGKKPAGLRIGRGAPQVIRGRQAVPHKLGGCVPITLVEVVRDKLEMREEIEAIEGSNKLRGLQVGEGGRLSKHA